MSVEEKIYNAFKKGQNEKAFSLIYNLCFPKVRAYITKNNGSNEDAQDIFQDAVLILMRTIYRNRDTNKKISAFVFIISKNLWIDKVRKDKRFVEYQIKGEPIEECYDCIVENMEIQEREAEIQSILKQLGEKCFQIIQELLKNDKDYSEIAEIIGLKDRHVVKAYKNRCKNRMIELLKEHESIRNILFKYEPRFKKYI